MLNITSVLAYTFPENWRNFSSLIPTLIQNKLLQLKKIQGKVTSWSRNSMQLIYEASEPMASLWEGERRQVLQKKGEGQPPRGVSVQKGGACAAGECARQGGRGQLWEVSEQGDRHLSQVSVQEKGQPLLQKPEELKRERGKLPKNQDQINSASQPAFATTLCISATSADACKLAVNKNTPPDLSTSFKADIK
ncbi:unnamed protein product [Lepidochelys kempii]